MWTREPIYPILSRENITVSNAVKTLTATHLVSHFFYAQVQVQTASIRVTGEGTDPDPAAPVGDIYPSGTVLKVWGYEGAANFKMIREGADDAYVEVTYYGGGK